MTPDPEMIEIADSLTPWAYFFCTSFAACLASFSNVVIWRVPRHESIVSPPSACPKCGKRIRWFDNIPILSWLFLRGKCRNCKTPISPRYIIVESIGALFGALLCHQVVVPLLPYYLIPGVSGYSIALFALLSIFTIGCLALALIDYDTTELPPEITLPLAGLGLFTAWLVPETAPFHPILGNIDWVDSLLGATIGGGIIVAIIGLYYIFTKRIGMGGGDIWMMTMIGAFLGWEALPFIFLASSLQGIIAAVIAQFAGAKQQHGDRTGFFKNEIADEINDEIHNEADASCSDNADSGTADASDDQDQPLAHGAPGKLAIPYGPFIALAGVEYLFFANLLLPLISGGTLTPWGLIPNF